MRGNERRRECVVRVDLGGKGRLRNVKGTFKVQREE